MSEEDRLDIVEATDEEGNSLFLKVQRYFYYNGNEYVLLQRDQDENVDSRTGGEALYVMRVEISKDEDGDEVEDFLPVEGTLMEALIRLAVTDFREEEGPSESG